jgi:uncharacterized membrane protein
MFKKRRSFSVKHFSLEKGFAGMKDLLVIIGFVVVSSVIITVPPLSSSLLRVIVGSLLVLFIPGYLLVSTLFPRNDEIDAVERIALSIGLNLCIVVFVGLCLNYTPWGIRLNSILLALSAFILVFTVLSALRRIHVPESERFKPF